MSKLTYEIVAKAVAWFILRDQVRKTYDEGELQRLGESMRAVGQFQPVGAKPDGTVLWGHRRVLAARRVGIEELAVVIADQPLSESDVRILQLTENVQRADLTPFERYQGCKELLRLNSSWKGADLAQHLHLDPGTVTKILSADKVCGPVQEAFAAGNIGPSEVYAISKADTEAEQLELLAAKLSGATRDQIEKKRGAASRSAPQVRLARVRCPLPTGATVTVAGDEMSLEDLIEALSAALAAARKAVKESLDVKTAQRVWADKAKAGA